jgi:hypothetical protein
LQFVLAGCYLLIGTIAGADQELYTKLLTEYVHQGKVRYSSLCKDPGLGQYIAQLSKTDPEKIKNRNSRLAFWINTYNAYTLKIICDNYPVKSINDLHSGGRILGTVFKTTVWDKEFIDIHGRKLSLNTIEHKIIRKQFKEPRAHFALVCASISCPPLRPEAYRGQDLDHQLDDQARIFFADTSKNTFDLQRKVARLSKIMDWYSEDFGKDKEQILLFISRFLPDKAARAIQSDPGEWKVEYTKYNWNLNE